MSCYVISYFLNHFCFGQQLGPCVRLFVAHTVFMRFLIYSNLLTVSLLYIAAYIRAGWRTSTSICISGILSSLHDFLETNDPLLNREVWVQLNINNKCCLHFTLRSTADLESFRNHILMYAGQRFSLSPAVYTAWTMLAGIDYSHHLHRPVKRKEDGSLKYVILYASLCGWVNVLQRVFTVILRKWMYLHWFVFVRKKKEQLLRSTQLFFCAKL